MSYYDTPTMTAQTQSGSRHEMMSPVTRENVSFVSDRESEGADRIWRSVEFMKQRLGSPLQVSTLAASVNVSQSHYFALFKRVTGRTPIDYFIRLRIDRACELLKQPSASVKGVAAEMGYEDPFYFSRVFRAVLGVPPSGYRNQVLSGGESMDFGASLESRNLTYKPMDKEDSP